MLQLFGYIMLTSVNNAIHAPLMELRALTGITMKTQSNN